MNLGFPESLKAAFEPVSLIGAGGMGVVFLARDRSLERLVAIKLITSLLDEKARRRFLREAECLCRLRHASIVELYDAGEVPEGPYLVMEYIEGAPVNRDVRQADVTGHMVTLAGALDVIHAEGLVHRDLKPENVILTRDGRLVVIDFGLALEAGGTRITASGAVVGTVPYIAPEVIRGGSATAAADWYSWGVLFYELVEGHLPYAAPLLLMCMEGDDLPAPEFACLSRKSTRRAVIEAALAVDPSRRPGCVADVRAILEAKARARRMEEDEDELSMSAAVLDRLVTEQVARPRAARPARAPRAERAGPAPRGRRYLLYGAAFGATMALGALIPSTWFGSPAAPRATATPGPSSPAPSPMEVSVQEVTRRDLAAHLTEDGQLRIIGRGGNYGRHLTEAVAAFQDSRATIRWRRYLEVVGEWIRATLPHRPALAGADPVFSDPEVDRVLRAHVLPMIQHFRRDFRMISIAHSSLVIGDGVGSYPGVEHGASPGEVIKALERQREVDAEIVHFLNTFPSDLGRLPDAALALRTLLYRDDESGVPFGEELDRRFARRPGQVPDEWLVRAELSLFPSSSAGRDPLGCDVARTRLEGVRTRVRALAPTLAPESRLHLEAELVYVHLSLLNACRTLSDEARMELVKQATELHEVVAATWRASPLDAHAWSYWFLLVGNFTYPTGSGDGPLLDSNRILQAFWPRVRAVGEEALAAATGGGGAAPGAGRDG